jgi:4-hydroxybenzoyl-CoA thioesterase
MLVNRRDVEIEWGDCDAAGIVFYPRYFAMFDASTAYLLEKALGEKKIGWVKTYGIIGIPMVDTGAKFIIPSRYGDVITIESQASDIRRSSFDIQHRVFKHDELAIEAHETRVWTARDPDDPSRLKAVPVPQEVIDALSRA